SPTVVSVSGNTYEKLGSRGNVTTMPRYKAADYDPDRNSVEDLANAVIRFENGASLLLDCSYSLHATKDSIDVSVYGEKGGAELEPALHIATEMHDSAVNIEPQIASRTFEFGVGCPKEIQYFVGAAQGRADSIAPSWHGVEIARIREAIDESARTGREISLA